jgi:hypothetical protein
MNEPEFKLARLVQKSIAPNKQPLTKYDIFFLRTVFTRSCQQPVVEAFASLRGQPLISDVVSVDTFS